MPFVFSTQSQNTDYVEHVATPEGQPYRVGRRVKINGGANVANRKTLDTARGAVTEVSDDDLAFLEKNADFVRHVKAGFITVERKPAAVDKVAKNMTAKDGSAQKTAKDFEGSKAKPTTLEVLDNQNVEV